jgi:hypothetical protein
MFLDIIHRPVLSRTPSCFYLKSVSVQRWGLGQTEYVLSEDGDRIPSPWTGTNCTDWAPLSRFYLKTEIDSSLRNNLFLNKNRAVF